MKAWLRRHEWVGFAVVLIPLLAWPPWSWWHLLGQLFFVAGGMLMGFLLVSYQRWLRS